MNRDSTAWFLKYYIFTTKHQEGYIFKLLKHDAFCVFGAEKEKILWKATIHSSK